MKKKRIILTAAAGLHRASASTAFAGWHQEADGRYWYSYDDGSYPTNSVKTIDGYDYCFDANGYMLTGWQYVNFKWYYFDPVSGTKVYGWQFINGNWYYLDPQDFGAMYTYWLNLDGNRYYLDENGVMQTGRFFLSDPTTGSSFAYQADQNGVLYRNRKIDSSDGSVTFRYDSEGIMMYSTPVTRKVAKLTGEDEWQYVLNEEGQRKQNEENEQIILDGVNELKNEFYEEYRDDVRGKSGSSRQNIQARWEEKVTRKMKDLVDANELAQYISQVENGTYIRAKLSTEYDEEDED